MTKEDIPSRTNGDGWTDPVEVSGGYSVRVHVEYDETMGEPWKEHDGHGPVRRMACGTQGSARASLLAQARRAYRRGVLT